MKIELPSGEAACVVRQGLIHFTCKRTQRDSTRMNTLAAWLRFSRLLIAAIMPFFIFGCERDSDTSDAESYFEANPYTSEDRTDPDPTLLSVLPSASAIGVVGQEVVFTARGGSGSYSWSVTDRSVGVVHSLRTSQCTYECRRVGYNTIIVKDDEGHYAAAQITPPQTSLTISPSEASLVMGAGNMTVGFVVSGGSPPYTWSVASPTLGSITYSSASSDQASYTAFSGRYGGNMVTVRDSAGHTASAAITQNSE